MTPVEIETIKRYIAAFVDYEFAAREVGADGERGGWSGDQRRVLSEAERQFDALSHPMFK